MVKYIGHLITRGLKFFHTRFKVLGCARPYKLTQTILAKVQYHNWGLIPKAQECSINLIYIVLVWYSVRKNNLHLELQARSKITKENISNCMYQQHSACNLKSCILLQILVAFKSFSVRDT